MIIKLEPFFGMVLDRRSLPCDDGIAFFTTHAVELTEAFNDNSPVVFSLRDDDLSQFRHKTRDFLLRFSTSAAERV